MVPDLARAFSIPNLAQAWRWLQTNPEPVYPGYFGEVYRAYALSADANLKHLHEQLANNLILPTHSTKIYLPKSSGIQRAHTLLGIEDQIVYQALANIIAPQLDSAVRRHYYKINFGNVFAGKSSLVFYRSWKFGYKRFSSAIRKAFKAGFKFSATFDLTACFDSIDHSVLTYFLKNLTLSPEFCKYLTDLLAHWTASSLEPPIYHGHGIPQGPQPSGLLAECVLRYFDERTPRSKKFRYFRYIDDIRLYATSERELRVQLAQLDLKSKEIGLFPQSSKIQIHLIKNVEDEIKGISNPLEPGAQKPAPQQWVIHARLRELTPRFKVVDETRFKFVVTRTITDAKLANRLLRVVENQPHLYWYVFNSLHRFQTLPESVSRRCLDILRQSDQYHAVTAEIIRTLHGRVHNNQKKDFEDFCGETYRAESCPDSSDLRSALAMVLLHNGLASWPEMTTIFKTEDWWTRSSILQYIRKDIIGAPSLTAILNSCARDSSTDVALIAIEKLIVEGLEIQRPYQEINEVAQVTLKAASIIGRVQSGRCMVCETFGVLFGKRVQSIDWKSILKKHYLAVQRKTAPWRTYVKSDPNAWVNMTDTINDFIVDELFRHDSALGTYQLGNIGGVLNSGSAFGTTYPKLYKAVGQVHQWRLESDLSHPIMRRTNKVTRRFTFNQMNSLLPILREGYLEMSTNW